VRRVRDARLKVSSLLLFATRRLDLLSTLQLISFYTKATFAPI